MRIKHAFTPFHEKVILKVFRVNNMFFVVRPTNQMDPNGNSNRVFHVEKHVGKNIPKKRSHFRSINIVDRFETYTFSVFYFVRDVMISLTKEKRFVSIRIVSNQTKNTLCLNRLATAISIMLSPIKR